MARRRAEVPPHSESALREIAVRRLAHAPRTRTELSRDLLRRGADPECVESVLDHLADVGLIDDARFARMWVQSRHAGRGLARSVLRRELQERGVDHELIAEALDELDGVDERERARALVSRRLQHMSGVDPVTRQRRITAFLVRRGYPAGVASTLLAELSSVDEGNPDVLDESTRLPV